MGVKIAPVVILLVVLSVLHSRALAEHYAWLGLVQRLFFLPLFMATLLFGLKGGLLTAAVISLNYYSLLLGQEHGTWGGVAEAFIQTGLYFLTAIITGVLVDREKRESQRLKEAEHLALLGQTTAALAHELKNPLMAIGGFAVRMLREAEDNSRHRRQLEIIVNQTTHMEQLLREMLEYSRPLQLELGRHSLGELAGEVMEMAEPLAESIPVDLVFTEVDGPVAVLADAPRLKQVVLNLVQNAIHASQPGSQVRVVVRQNGHQGVVEVHDQGPGITNTDQSKIFTPFFTTKSQGTGLGLAVCKKIMDAHGGTLRVESEPGRGSSFLASFPLAP